MFLHASLHHRNFVKFYRDYIPGVQRDIQNKDAKQIYHIMTVFLCVFKCMHRFIFKY